jgi:ATP-dependent Clp protease ATP-binding subunit ClpA
MFERFSDSARAVFDDARWEAARRGDRRIGSDHLLLAVLSDEAMAEAVGVDAAAVRAAAARLDQDALASIGLRLGDPPPVGAVSPKRHMPLTSGAKTVIERTLVAATAERARRLTTRHMLLALLDRPEPDPADALLTALSVDRQRVRERLAATS